MADTTFASRLREARKKRKLSQQALGDLAGLHQVTIARLETGVREPSLDAARRLADALRCSLDWLAPPPEPAEKNPKK